MKPFWPATPSQAERTHVWDVSGIDWGLYPKGKALKSPTFSCGGLDGLYIQFFPNGNPASGEGEGRVGLLSDLDFGVAVSFNIRINDVTVFAGEGFHHDIFQVAWGEAFRRSRITGPLHKLLVELLSVKRKLKPEEVKKMPCSTGDVLRIVRDEKRASESFHVVGCDKIWWNRLMPYLGQTGVAVKVNC